MVIPYCSNIASLYKTSTLVSIKTPFLITNNLFLFTITSALQKRYPEIIKIRIPFFIFIALLNSSRLISSKPNSSMSYSSKPNISRLISSKTNSSKSYISKPNSSRSYSSKPNSSRSRTT